MTIWGPDTVSWSCRCLLCDVPEFLAVPLKLGFLQKVVQPASFSVTHSHRNNVEMAISILSHDCIWSPRQTPGDGFSHPNHSDVQHGCILSHFSSSYTELGGLWWERGREIAILLSPWRICCLQFSELLEANRSLWNYDTISEPFLDIPSLFVGLVDSPCRLILYLNMESQLRADGYS